MTLADLANICNKMVGGGFPIHIRTPDGKTWEIKELETTHHASEKGTMVSHALIAKDPPVVIDRV